MVDARQIANIVTIQDYFSRQLVHILFDFIVFHHEDDEIDVVKEFVQVVILVRHDVLRNERIVHLEPVSQMSFLTF